MRSFLRGLRSLVILAAVLAGLFYGLSQTGRWDTSPARSTVHEVIYYVGDKPENGGSGVMIAPMLMLTAAHVTEGEPGQNGVLLVGSEKAPARVLRKDSKKDLALLQVAKGCPCARVGSLPAPGVEVTAFGFPYTDVFGIVFETRGLSQGLNKGMAPGSFVYTAQGAPGGSGGGVFAWQGAQWYLVGISLRRMNEYAESARPMFPPSVVPISHIMSGASADTIKEFLNTRSPAEMGAVKSAPLPAK